MPVHPSVTASTAPPAPASDAELAACAARGDTGAFQQIMRRHNRLLFRTCRSILKSDEEAQDALQEAYLSAWRSISGFRAEARLSTWLVRIVVNEALTLGGGFGAVTPHAAPSDWLTVTGGAIGGGIPLATGAAIGAQAMGRADRRVVTLQADGSAAYTIQGLWTQARENLPVTTLLLNNRSYAILMGEYAKVGAEPGRTALDMMSLDRPAIDWSAIAKGFGVVSATVTTLEALDDALGTALALDGPMLIDVQFP